MNENSTHLSLKKLEQYGKLPKIVVMGVGGGGCNAINNMMEKKIDGVEFIAVNTDIQSLTNSKSHKIIQLGKNTTKGQGAGSYPEIGLSSAEESREEIEEALKDTQLLFLTAGMGGGTGTGATPFIAKIAKEKDILTIAVVTKPFQYEAEIRLQLAEQGISELKKYTDTIIILPNENLFRIANKETTLKDAFISSDNVLYLGVRGITDLITTPGLINLDFADVRMVIKKMGRAMMGMGEAEGENRAIRAVEEALSNPLLEDVNIKGATGALVNITGSTDMTLFEVDDAAKRVREEIGGSGAIIKVGTAFLKELDKKIRVSIFATGMKDENENLNKHSITYPKIEQQVQPTIYNQNDISANYNETNIIQRQDLSNQPSPNKSKENNIDNQQNPNFGKTRITAKKDEEYFDMKSPIVEENITDDEKSSFSLFNLFNSTSDKNTENLKSEHNETKNNTFKSKNREIEFKNNSLNLFDREDINIPAYLRKKK